MVASAPPSGAPFVGMYDDDVPPMLAAHEAGWHAPMLLPEEAPEPPPVMLHDAPSTSVPHHQAPLWTEAPFVPPAERERSLEHFGVGD